MKKLVYIYFVFISVKMFGQDSPGALLTVQNFHSLRNYILASGKVEKVDISNNSSGKFVTYNSIEDGKWTITVDHSNRIYFNVKGPKYSEHFGNILFEEGKVVTEFNYGIPDKSKKMLAEEKKNRIILLNEFKILLGKTKK